MQTLQVRDEAHWETMSLVVNLFITGNKNATAIAKQLGLPRKDVLEYIDEWKEVSKNTDGVKDRAIQALNDMDLHFDLIIKKQWEIANDETVNANVRSSTLKAIADVESKRQETLQKAGLYDDAGIADQIVEMEEKVEAIKQLLVSVAKTWPETKQYIIERLAMLDDAAVPVPMQGEVVTD